MFGEVWTYIATNPNNGTTKARPVLIVGDAGDNQLSYVDIHYVIISSSADCGFYDVELEDTVAKSIGLNGPSVIKTTKIYTGAKSMLGSKISELPSEKREEFARKYVEYQQQIISKFKEMETV